MRRYLAATLLAAATVLVASAPANAATVTVQAEAYAAQSGSQLETTADTGGGQNVAYLGEGDWLRYDNVALTGVSSVSARVASAVGAGRVELRTGSTTGPLLAQFAITATGGWQTWTTLTATAAAGHPVG